MSLLVTPRLHGASLPLSATVEIEANVLAILLFLVLLPLANAPAARAGHTAVWTGDEMIVCVNGVFGTPPRMEAVLIRAPRITRVGDEVTPLAWLDGDPVLVAAGAVVAATFHPELSRDRRVHRYVCGLGADP